MNVFLTGAGGYIGSAVVRALVDAGHSVLGLTHTPRMAAGLADAGCQPIVGDMKAPEGWKKHAAACDALIHCAVETGPDAVRADKTALETLIEAARSADAARLLVYTSGVWVLGPRQGAPADEAAPPNPLPLVAWRPAHEKLALDAAGGRLRTVVLRPGCVYGGRGGLFGLMLKPLASERVVRLIEGGSNAWAVVHRKDLADLYRRIIEGAGQSGIYHGTDGSAEPLRAIAEAFVEAADGGSIQNWPLPAARETLGPLADALAIDQRVSSDKARRELGWTPEHTSIVEDAEELWEEWREPAGKAAGS